jgi:iron complex outermembrane receptor protein
MIKTGLLVSTCLVSVALCASPVRAQTAQEPPETASPREEVGGDPAESQPNVGATAEENPAALSDIVVTAQRRTERLQDVPVSVTAFGSAAIEQLNLNDTLRTSKFVPGMISQHNAGLASANAFFLRGLGNTQSTPTFDAPVTTYVDDVYIARQNANNYAFFDTERVEVLRGPQGTLFGRNTTGGAINVIMRKPSPTPRMSMEATAGSFRRATFKVTADRPLSETVLTKISGFGIYDRGHLKNITTGERLNGEKSYGIRGDIRFLPTERLTVDLSTDYTVNNSTYAPIRHVPAAPGSNPFVVLGGLAATRPIFYETASGLPKGPCGGHNVNLLTRTGRGNCNLSKTFAVNANVAYDAAGGTINYIFGYRRLDQGYVVSYDASQPNPFASLLIIADNGLHKQHSHELKYNTDLFGDRLHLVTGIFYLKENSDDRQTNFSGTAASTSFVPNVDQHLLHEVETAAIYAQADLDVTDALTFTLGARYTWEHKEIDYLASTEFPGLGYTTAQAVAAGNPVEQTKKKITPRIAVNYKITPDIMLFASATNGFKSGGWNGNAALPANAVVFGPETTWSYEGGIKSELFNRRVRFNATGFFARTEGLQVTAGIGTPPRQIPFNAGTLEVYGVEIESNFVISRDLSIFANPAIMRGEYTFIVPGAVGITTDIEPVRIPKFQFAGGVIYETPVAALGGSIGATATWRHNSPYWVAILNTTTTRTEDFVDASINYKTDDENTQLSFEVSNLTKEKTVTANFLSLFAGDPRRFTVRVRQRF